MKIIYVSCLLLLGTINFALGQETTATFNSKHEFQLNYLTEFSANGNRYGFMLGYNKAILSNSSQSYQLGIGVINEFFVKDERDIEGITGNTLSNIVGISVSNKFFLLKNQKLYTANTLYAGWGHRKTDANYQNQLYDINRDYQSTVNYFALGAYWSFGYKATPTISVQAIGKTDFSRLVDKYEPTIFERPGFMYGIGITYAIQ